MTTGFLATMLIGALAGGFMNGLSGFGTALLALGIWLQVLSPQEAVPVVIVMTVISGFQGVWIVRDHIQDNPRRLARFVVPALIGVPLGVMLLSMISALALKLTIAGFMILYGGFFTLRRTLPQFERPSPVADSTIGFLGGVLGGAASLSGALPTMWCAMRPWTKGETRAVLQPYNVVVLGLTMLILIWQGSYTRETIMLIILTLPATIIGAQLGIMVFHRLNDIQFRWLLIVLMFASGMLIGLPELF